jgi:hypothetical protein
MNKFIFFGLTMLIIVSIYCVLSLIARIFRPPEADYLEKKYQQVMADKKLIDSLANDELQLLKKLDFSTKLLSKIKPINTNKITQLHKVYTECADEFDDEYFEGVFLSCSEREAKMAIHDLKHEFQQQGYLIFRNDSDHLGSGLAVIKGSEPWDILRYRQTDGCNYGLDTEAIINKLRDWEVTEVLGVGRDWVEFDFGRFADDEMALATELYEFCPDIIEQGLGSVEELADCLDVSTQITLWWD